MPNFVELSGGTIVQTGSLSGGVIVDGSSLSGAGSYPIMGSGGGGANIQTSKSVSYTPTETAITDQVTPSTGYQGIAKVNVSVGAISSSYVGSGVSRQSGSTIAPTESVQTAVPSGTYVTGNVKIGAISSTYIGSSVPTQAGSTITPTNSVQTAVPSGTYVTGNVKVAAIPSGSATTPSTTITEPRPFPLIVAV